MNSSNEKYLGKAPKMNNPDDYAKLIKSWKNRRLLRGKQSREMRRAVVEKGLPLFKKYGVCKVVLFGSLIDDAGHENSDIDLLVVPLPSGQYWRFRSELEEVLDCPVDLYTQDDDTTFTAKIMERGQVIYEA